MPKFLLPIFAAEKMVIIAQLVRASDCGSEGRGFETHWSPLPAPVFIEIGVIFSVALSQRRMPNADDKHSGLSD